VVFSPTVAGGLKMRMPFKNLLIGSTLVLLLCVGQAARSADPQPHHKVYLMTSFKAPPIKRKWIRKRIVKHYEKAFKKFERSAREAFAELPYQVEVIHQADAFDLYQALTSPNTKGLIWLSHAAYVDQETIPVGLASESVIVDVEAFDIKQVFQAIRPELEFLSVIACNSSKIIYDVVEDRGVSENLNPNLVVHDFSKKIGARKGLRKTLRVAVERLAQVDDDSKYEAFTQTGRILSVERIRPELKEGEFTPALGIFMNDKLTEVLPPLEEPEHFVHPYQLCVPQEILNQDERKLIFSTGTYYGRHLTDLVNGDFRIGTVEGLWKGFRKPSDRSLFGTTFHLFYKPEKFERDLVDCELERTRYLP
jgi:hypothetical protein